MRVVSWNVNGIRACLGKGLESAAAGLEADFLCLQESKASEDQVPLAEYPLLHGQRAVWSSAEKKGYSGTVIFTRDSRAELSNRMGIPAYDAEGRANVAFGKGFTVVNLYFPNGAASDERHRFKMKFLDDFLLWAKKLEAERGPLIICGDYNIAHTEIDIHDPVRNQDSSGFRPEERAWMTKFLAAGFTEERAWMTKFLAAGFTDTFRALHPDALDQYSWWSFRQASRARNKGWRIDYICVSDSLRDKIRAAAIHPQIMGSDHCPVSVELSL